MKRHNWSFKQMKKNKFLILIVFLLQIPSLHAVSFSKYAGEYLSLGAGSRALALAGAYTAMANDVSAAYWNPAGLMEAGGLQAEFMHSKQFISSVQYNYFGISHPLDKSTAVAFSFLYLTVNDIKDSRNAWDLEYEKVNFSKIDFISSGDYSFYVSYAMQYAKKMNVGFNVKMLYRDYDVENALGIGFDIGAKYFVTPKFPIGLMVRDVTSTLIAWSTEKKELITPSIRLGATYDFSFNSFHLNVRPSADLAVLFENREFSAQYNFGSVSADILFGLELEYYNTLALRVGRDDLGRFNTGVGLKIPKLMFDYSFTAFQSELGDIHRISFHLYLEEIL
jgi:hypothetical protein